MVYRLIHKNKQKPNLETIIEIKNLQKKFGYLTAVDGLSFEMKKGLTYGLLGPNGSGKSTTLGMILNVVNPTSGSFSWFGGNFTTHQALKKIGAIIEHPNFYPFMSAYQNLKLVCKIKQISYEQIDSTLELVGLLERKNSKFKNFSLGMKQRLAIASALLNNPEILILDEPTNGLDPEGIHQIRELIKKIAKNGTTILLASHLLDEVEKVCDQVVILRKGKMLYSGPVDEISATHGFFELKSNNPEKLMAVLEKMEEFSSPKIKDNLVIAFLKSPLEADTLNKILFEQNIIVSHLVKRKENLEEQFLKLTQKEI